MSDHGLESVREYYGRVLKTNQDLKTSACCTTDGLPAHQKAILKEIGDEILEKFYGCGSPIPFELEGRSVLDLGSGSGRDAFLMSKLVGPEGKVVGVDMTDEQLDVARRHVDEQTRRFGFSRPNVEFKKGYIEDLESLGIRSNSVDVVSSNCVINLSPDKRRVFSEIFRVLKPGGELFFADIFASRRLPREMREDAIMLGECLGGAMYIEDFRRMLGELGCADYRLTANSKITLNDDRIRAKAGHIDFYSMTVRAFKLDLEDRCEDYGQFATYLGTMADTGAAFRLDDHHLFEAHRPVAVCGNTAAMLRDSRYGRHFKIDGTTDRHFGLFDCAPVAGAIAAAESSGACC